jgi:K(+)-stimulated pyrophosphate-energized sodium pump
MAGLDPSVRQITDKLDSVGNTTAAIGKGFCIGSATLTSLALIVGYFEACGVKLIDITNPQFLVGILVGAMLPYFFSALTIASVGRAANKMIEEVRSQFDGNPEILKGNALPDYAKCIDISTKASLVEMILPGVIAVFSPIAAGFIIGPVGLGGLLMGGLASAIMLAVFMANAGGAWDNAKKYIEEGHFGGKGSESHHAAVTGDTVGDPLKDTAGPAMDILIKLMSMIALIIAPVIANIDSLWDIITKLLNK